jgi:hypothetical protein
VYLLGSNFALIQEVFEHPEHWTKLEPGPITGETETQYVSPHVRRRPLLSWDAPQSRYFSPFVVTAGIGALGLLVAFLDEWLPVGVQPVPRIVAGALGFIFAALAVVFFRRWRAERAGRMTPGAGRHGENTT